MKNVTARLRTDPTNNPANNSNTREWKTNMGSLVSDYRERFGEFSGLRNESGFADHESINDLIRKVLGDVAHSALILPLGDLEISNYLALPVDAMEFNKTYGTLVQEQRRKKATTVLDMEDVEDVEADNAPHTIGDYFQKYPFLLEAIANRTNADSIFIGIEAPRDKAIFDKLYSQSKRLCYLRDLVVSAVINQEGTTSYRSTLYYYIGCGLPVAASVKYFPDSEPLNVLYSNLIFSSATLLTRVFFNSAKSIDASMVYFKAHYDDLEDYVEELYGLGFITKDAGRYEVGDEVRAITYIVLSVWDNFMQSKELSDLGVINKFRFVDASLNMFKALANYLVSQRSEAIKAAIMLYVQRLDPHFKHDPLVASINYTNLAEKYKIDILKIIASLPKIAIDDAFVKKVVFEFTAILQDKTYHRNPLRNIAKLYRPYHLSFSEVPDISAFASGLFRKGYVKSDKSEEIDRDSSVARIVIDAQAQANDEFIKKQGAVGYLQKNLPMFDIFTLRSSEFPIDANASRLNDLMTHIGRYIKNRAGEKFPWYINEPLSFINGLLGGLPLFSYMYQREDIFKLAYYFVAPITWTGVFLIASIQALVSVEERRFKDEYKEYENKIKLLIDSDDINILNYTRGVLTNNNVHGSKSFDASMLMIARVLDTTYKKAGITKDSLSDKDNAFMAVRLFNAFGDLMLRIPSDSVFDPNKVDALVNKLADKYSERIVNSKLYSLYHGHWSSASFRAGLGKQEILETIVTELGIKGISHAEVKSVSHTAKEEARRGNAVNLGLSPNART